MGRKFKKAAAALLVAAMFLQQCNVVSFAESDLTEMSADAQAAAEAQAQAEAEAAAQAAAEAQAQAEAEAAAQAAAEAEAAAQAAAEAQAQAEAEAAQAAAEAQAQAEAEAAAAQAAAEAQAQAEAEAAAQAAAEAEAAAQAEAEAQAAAEAETEQQARSARVNAGMEIRRDDLTTMLENVLPYLFVAETLVFPETQEEEAQEPDEEESLPIPEDWVMEGDPAYTELTDQVWNSLALADAQSTEEVTVINLYADEVGTLDTTQLYNIYEDQILDVTDNRYYVVNVIADSPDQVLDFSGFDLSENGFYLYYTESTQPCSVLYNFAAMDGEEYTYYKGTLRLWGDLQGTVLAPAATVEVEQNLAGAVYARTISVISPEAQLQRNIYIEGEPEVLEPETEAPVTEAPAPETEEPAPETEAVTEAPALETEAPAPETEAAEPEIIEAPAPETEAPAPETEAVTEEPETESETEAELETEIVTEAPETEPETEIVTEAPETETETEVATEAPETETETEEPEAIKTLGADEPAVIGEEDEYTLKLTAEVYYKGTKLTAYGKDRSCYIGLFADEDGTKIIGDPEELIIKESETESNEITFKNLSAGDYYVYEVNSQGIRKEDAKFTIEKMPIKVKEKDGDLVDDTKTVNETLQLIYDEYPKGDFSYDVTVSVKLNVTGHDGKALKTDETFYVMIYEDKNLENEAIEKPIEFAMDGKSHLTEKVTIKPTKDEQTFYVGETNKKGEKVTGDSSFVYTPTYESTENSKRGEFKVEIGKDPDSPTETITNNLNDSVVKLKITDTEGNKLSKASFIIMDSSGEIVKIDDEEFFTGSLNVTNVLTDGSTYYLYEVDAPNGYTPEPRKEFTVSRGLTTEVTLKNKATKTTNNSVSVTKSVYVDQYAVYATSPHTYSFALFSDSDHTEKVSNVETVTINNSYTGKMSFENVDPNGEYYLSETDDYGIALSSNGNPSIAYSTTSNGKVTYDSITVQNTYSYLPDGYCYTGKLTLTKAIRNAADAAVNASGTFYIGLYKNADYSDSPTVIPISLNNASSESVTNTFRLPNETQTYYIAEVSDSKGTERITDSSDFSYAPTVSQSSVTITRDSINNNIPSVTVTNTEKVDAADSGPTTSVELYLTKRVYEGSNYHETSDTFYVGLFKDPEMTELYADPIPMPMAGREDGDLTQKITMSVSESKETIIYVAEVHADGTPVTESQYQSFGYEIGSEQPIQVKFAPSEGQDQMRAVILNGVYGTMTAEDWQNIYDEIEDLYGDDDEIGLADDLEEDAEENGLSTVQTADNTPVAGTMALMAAALIVLGFSIRRRRRAS